MAERTGLQLCIQVSATTFPSFLFPSFLFPEYCYNSSDAMVLFYSAEFIPHQCKLIHINY